MKPSEEILQLCRLMNTVPMFIADPLLGTVNPTWEKNPEGNYLSVVRT